MTDYGSERESWVFFCPVHGEEHVVFCHRATNENLADCWKKMHIVSTEVPSSLRDRLNWQEVFTKHLFIKV